MKAQRIAARQADLDAAVALSNLNKMLGEPNDSASVGTSAGFVFKPEEIDTESRRLRLKIPPTPRSNVGRPILAAAALSGGFSVLLCDPPRPLRDKWVFHEPAEAFMM
jgi:hypothetical protein